MSDKKLELEDQIYRQSYATAKALCAAKEDGVHSMTGKSELYIGDIKHVIEVSINFSAVA